MKIDTLKDDHHRLLTICKQAESFCLATLSVQGIESILTLLRDFAVELDAHLVCEDTYLYPYLMQQETASISQLATRFKQEMGGLNKAMEQYFAKWNAESAAANKVEFICELCDLVGHIRTRIHKEEAVLFPLMGMVNRPLD